MCCLYIGSRVIFFCAGIGSTFRSQDPSWLNEWLLASEVPPRKRASETSNALVHHWSHDNVRICCRCMCTDHLVSSLLYNIIGVALQYVMEGNQ